MTVLASFVRRGAEVSKRTTSRPSRLTVPNHEGSNVMICDFMGIGGSTPVNFYEHQSNQQKTHRFNNL